MVIQRTEYLNKLIAFKDKQLIKIVTGVRRCGKSTLLEIYQDWLRNNGVADEQIISINFEDIDYEELTDYKKLYAYLKQCLSKNKITYIFLDEVQHNNDFLKIFDILYINKNIDLSFKELLRSKNINFIESDSTLSSKYPNNISLNAYITDNYLIHNLNFTDKKILDYCKNKKTINVKQGYTKCSILPVKEKAIITNDKGIYDTLKNENFDILLLPFGDIELSGFNYGFIGGVGGMISDNSMAFFGSLDNYIFGNEVKNFLYKYDVKPIYLNNTKLIDRGSLLVF